MKVLILTKDNEKDIIKESLKILKKGGVVAYPTESFYALGVMALDEKAVKRIFKLKERSVDKPLPVIVGNLKVLKSMVKGIPLQAESLISRYWPGPLTLVFEAIDNLSVSLTAGTGKVAARIPGESFALSLARKASFPITATSANPSSLPPATNASEIRGYFEDGVDLIVDAGESPGGQPSTIVDITCHPPRLIRQGRLLLV